MWHCCCWAPTPWPTWGMLFAASVTYRCLVNSARRLTWLQSLSARWADARHSRNSQLFSLQDCKSLYSLHLAAATHVAFNCGQAQLIIGNLSEDWIMNLADTCFTQMWQWLCNVIELETCEPLHRIMFSWRMLRNPTFLPKKTWNNLCQLFKFLEFCVVFLCSRRIFLLSYFSALKVQHHCMSMIDPSYDLFQDHFKSAYFFFEGVFYNDMRFPECQDISM